MNHNEVFFFICAKKNLGVIGQGGLEVIMWPTPQPLLSNLKNRSQLFIGSGNHKPSLMMKLGLVKEQTLIPKLKGLKKKLT
jgi:hypothetical protein